jgi:hypothetical protein
MEGGPIDVKRRMLLVQQAEIDEEVLSKITKDSIEKLG